MITPRQKEILKLIKKGASNTEVAEKLNISINTVTHQLWRAYKTLKVKNRIQAVNRV
jgi:DNA-binding NarL/FixJ family response regulator